MGPTSNSVKQDIDRLRAELERHSRLYYVEARPEISDLEFDKLLKQLEQLEQQHPEFDSPDSPTHKVGGEPIAGFQTVAHRLPMLSIDNIYEEEKLAAFDERLAKLLGEGPRGNPNEVLSGRWRGFAPTGPHKIVIEYSEER